MDTVRYWIAVIALLATPPAILVWYVIHPLAPMWRRLGSAVTTTALIVIAAGIMAGIWVVREPLLGADLGTSWATLAAGLATVALAAWLGIHRKRQLTTRILTGIPEFSAAAYPGELLTEGVYSAIRNPRYVEVFLAVLAYALLANYTGTYILALLVVPTSLYLVVLLEERELRDRFGAEWDAYAARVPRFVPARGDGDRGVDRGEGSR